MKKYSNNLVPATLHVASKTRDFCMIPRDHFMEFLIREDAGKKPLKFFTYSTLLLTVGCTFPAYALLIGLLVLPVSGPAYALKMTYDDIKRKKD